MAESNHNKRPPVAWVVWIVGVAMSWPALAVVLVWRRIKWRNAWISLSVLFNVFFVSICAIVALDPRTANQKAEDRLQALMGLDCVEYAPESWKFCRPRMGSEMARMEPNVVYLVERGVRRLHIEYEDENKQVISDISTFDELGRRWINVNFQDGLISFDHYSGDGSLDPDLSFTDRDLDGIPDQKIDWVLVKGFERVGEIVWRPLKKRDD